MTQLEVKKIIDSVECFDFSIQELKNDNWLLILVCRNEQQSLDVFRLVTTLPYKIAGFAKDADDSYKIVLFFEEMGLQLVCRSEKTINSYHVIENLESNKISEITAGVEDGESVLGYPRYIYRRTTTVPFSSN